MVGAVQDPRGVEDLRDLFTTRVGYVVLEGVREPVRVRFTHVRDSDLVLLADRANRYSVGRPPPPSWTATG